MVTEQKNPSIVLMKVKGSETMKTNQSSDVQRCAGCSTSCEINQNTQMSTDNRKDT